MKAYKLTNENGQTKNQTQWGPNVSHSAKGEPGQSLCSDGWMHFYTNPLIAVLMNPIHAEFKSPKLWECETSGEELHEALKSGCKTLTTIEEIPLPEITLNQKIAFGILCAKEVCTDEAWNQWADRWLNGEDRTKESAAASDAAAINASAHDLGNAAYAAAGAANNARAAAAAYDAAIDVSNAAANASYAAAYAYAAAAAANINFIEIAEQAMNYA